MKFPCQCLWCRIVRCLAVVAWCALGVGALIIMFAITGCTTTDRNEDFMPLPHTWEVT